MKWFLSDQAGVVVGVLRRHRCVEKLGVILGSYQLLIPCRHLGRIYLEQETVFDPEFDELEKPATAIRSEASPTFAFGNGLDSFLGKRSLRSLLCMNADEMSYTNKGETTGRKVSGIIRVFS